LPVSKNVSRSRNEVIVAARANAPFTSTVLLLEFREALLAVVLSYRLGFEVLDFLTMCCCRWNGFVDLDHLN